MVAVEQHREINDLKEMNYAKHMLLFSSAPAV